MTDVEGPSEQAGSPARPGSRVTIKYGPNLLPTNWNPRAVRGLIRYDCPVCEQPIDRYEDAGPTVDTATGRQVGAGYRRFLPCRCWVDRQPPQPDENGQQARDSRQAGQS